MSNTLQCLKCAGDTYANLKGADLSTTLIKTIEIFFYLDSATAGDYFFIVKQGAPSYQTPAEWKMNSSTQYKIKIREDNGATVDDYVTFTQTGTGTGAWYHFVNVRNESTGNYKYYFGQPGDAIGDYTVWDVADSGTGNGMEPWKSGALEAQIGIGSRENGSFPCDARLVEFRVWDDERSEAEIVANNNSFLSESGETGGILYMKLNESTSATYPVDFWGSANAIPYTDGASGVVGYTGADAHPFPEPPTPGGSIPYTMPMYILNNQQSFM